MAINLKNEQRQQELKNEYQLMYSNANQVADNLQHASGYYPLLPPYNALITSSLYSYYTLITPTLHPYYTLIKFL
jgi:hypothetical protein